ncbi:cell division ATP-binding protein FtsE [Candidatus Woesebacteria bacterium RIFCSPHIGHO2_01_FULL_39_17]|nr:MAG: Cell division ATP-binding protein FtsE [Candidatus Woesebacteria bacterium GW2011_GWB1_39_10b]OGM22542.1 MAG: cell division ATP-binding protein FtsE [Candidatus Woesebacteria bacterium RIFCSPHIGHO2_01_FULL_39_17]OGM63665.1 MAG: cell division ATP-binding protein FtsE [Candidatus Woesebacteria bacterium RIFCSPLOWO2_01_FULL_39_14]
MLELEKVTKTFGEIEALKDINFEVADSEFVFITGASGAGKTTLLRLILRELLPDSGKIELDKEDISKLPSKEIPRLRQKIGVVFQDYKVLSERTLRENVEVALAVIGLNRNDWEQRVNHVLKLVGLTERADLFPAQLSGGELQRVSLARALVVNPKIILADEPTGNLDWETADRLMDLFEKVNSEGKSIIMATHNRQIVDKMNKRVIELGGGKIIGDSGSKVKIKPEKEKK